MAPVFEHPIRRLLLGRLGFGVFYSIEARRMVIHAVIALKRDPQAIRQKIRKLLRLE